jgi:hypothetical protein
MIGINIFYLSLAFIAGMVLGLFYFGTLWLTIQHLPKMRRPELFTLGIMGGRWERLLGSLCGFIVARIFLTRRLRSERKKLPPT